MHRACDFCALRKVKCDGQSPCKICISFSMPCHRRRTRLKSGPKGPGKRTRAAISRMLQDENQLDQDTGSRTETITKSPYSASPAGTAGSPPAPRDVDVPLDLFDHYLSVYHRQLYVVWPMVDSEELLRRVRDQSDHVAYALALSLCAATIAQLRLSPDVHENISVHWMAAEAEKIRFNLAYRKSQTLDALLTSFFLHAFYSDVGQFQKSTVRLREAIAYAHLLGLHRENFYSRLDPSHLEAHLRVGWVLYITDRAHSLQQDIPFTFKLSDDIPEPHHNQHDQLWSSFTNLCRLFRSFDEAYPQIPSTPLSSIGLSADSSFSQSPSSQEYANALEDVNILVTDAWLRLILWKAAIPHVSLDTHQDGPDDRPPNIFYPLQIASTLFLQLSEFPLNALEAHGPGMVSKLFDISCAVADVIICASQLSDMSQDWAQPRRTLSGLFDLMSSLTSTSDPALLPLLEEKMQASGARQTTTKTAAA